MKYPFTLLPTVQTKFLIDRMRLGGLGKDGNCRARSYTWYDLFVTLAKKISLRKDEKRKKQKAFFEFIFRQVSRIKASLFINLCVFKMETVSVV